jgi:hypothetical protein
LKKNQRFLLKLNVGALGFLPASQEYKIIILEEKLSNKFKNDHKKFLPRKASL